MSASRRRVSPACQGTATRSASSTSPTGRHGSASKGNPRHGTADDPRIVLIGIDIHAAVFLEVDTPKPVVLFELEKGWLQANGWSPARHMH
jgi:hypothetical protein